MGKKGKREEKAYKKGGTGEGEGEGEAMQEQGTKKDRSGNEGRKCFQDALNTFLFTVIWRRTYGKGPLR